MHFTTATVAANGQLQLSEEQACALGVPDGGEIEIMSCDAHLELRRKRPSATFLDAHTLLGTLHTAADDAQSRARREDEEYARRTSGC